MDNGQWTMDNGDVKVNLQIGMLRTGMKKPWKFEAESKGESKGERDENKT